MGIGDVDVSADEDELVAAEAHHDVLGTGAVREAFADGHEDGVSDVVPVGVVDGLEVVEVDEHHGHPALGLTQELLEPVVEEATVLETGEGVVECKLGELRLVPPLDGRTDVEGQVLGILHQIAPGKAAPGDALLPRRERPSRRQGVVAVLGGLIAQPVHLARHLAADEHQAVAGLAEGDAEDAGDAGDLDGEFGVLDGERLGPERRCAEVVDDRAEKLGLGHVADGSGDAAQTQVSAVGGHRVEHGLLPVQQRRVHVERAVQRRDDGRPALTGGELSAEFLDLPRGGELHRHLAREHLQRSAEEDRHAPHRAVGAREHAHEAIIGDEGERHRRRLAHVAHELQMMG